MTSWARHAVGAVVLVVLTGCTTPVAPSAPLSPPAHASASPTPGSRSPRPPTNSALPTASPLIGPLTRRIALDRLAPHPDADSTPSRGGARLEPLGDGVLSGRVVVVDPGHNGVYRASVNTRQVPAGNGRTKACNSSGTAAVDGTAEHEVTWEVSWRLVGRLRQAGATVVLTRPDDAGIGPCVDERAAIADRADADLLLSVHGDGSLAPGARGFHVIVSSAMAGGSRVERTSRTVARGLIAAMDEVTDLPRSTYLGGGSGLSVRSDIAGLNLLARTPGVMLEMGNLRSRADWQVLGEPEGRDAVADALFDAAVGFLATE